MLSSGINQVKFVFFMISITSISGIEKEELNASGSVTAWARVKTEFSRSLS
jgi:hypothetical protein